LSREDYIGHFKARLNINRMNYKIPPGLYAVGKPDQDSIVFVSANYKMSFDKLRSSLANLDAWILVLDTKGINVWCAAGKGTFGTEELISKIMVCELHNIVNHRKLIVPQLGAVGIAAHTIKKNTGFQVIYGPVRANDIKKFIEADYKATNDMRTVSFNLMDRVVLIPIEMVANLKITFYLLIIIPILLGIDQNIYSFKKFFLSFPYVFKYLILGFVSGTILTPVLLPYIPGAMFAFKGLITGTLVFAIFCLGDENLNLMTQLSLSLILLAVASYFAMNFTGSSTYTSISGVKKEMKIAIPLQGLLLITGVVSCIMYNF
ncbi:MAG: CO dehydrogenase/acetyl-CoA synthase gamma subunit (Corrinoid Fe-S protein)-like protein, partial [uncultured bacterium]